jgi:hypothetical protein
MQDRQANRLTGSTGKEEDRKEGRQERRTTCIVDSGQAGDQADRKDRKQDADGLRVIILITVFVRFCSFNRIYLFPCS